ncbi:hypothetical protein SRB5_27260 [Streptomyces sp. RB5]|uniref:Tetratricopeptide repeat protein n=1 Tax=Streptomyces smaragdinus TaxID=2585196 RepID=A0A7K0CGI4_9ACTN|nr:hypothetical protein [Streptomyces smaragdinus]MQY12590.1 hypothetical protein [Streptomyces smaragdinus]
MAHGPVLDDDARRLLAAGREQLAHGDGAALETFQRLCRLIPRDWQGWYWSGCAAARLGDHAAAEGHFTEALQRDPAQGRAYVQRAYARLRLGRTGPARGDLLSAARHRGLDDDARWVSALLQLRAGEWAGAELAFKQLLARAGDRSGLALSLIAHAQERRGLPHAALASYEGIAEHTDGSLHRHALLAHRLERYDVSAALWRELAGRRADLPAVRRLAADAGRAAAVRAARDKDFTSALTILTGVEALYPEGELDAEFAELRLHAAWQAMASGAADGTERARELLRAACLDRPDDPRPLHYLGVLESLEGERRQAALLWRRVLRLDPGHRRARFALALERARDGDTDGATEELDGLRDAGDDRPALALAALHIRAGRWQQTALLLDPLPPGPLRDSLAAEAGYRSGELTAAVGSPHWRAAALCRAGHHRTAVKVLRHAGPAPDVRTGRELARLLRGAALTHAAAGRWGPAAELLDRDRAEGPLDALVLLLGGRRRHAVDLLIDAARRSPGDHRPAHALAVAALSTPGMWRQCIAAWTSVLYREDFRAAVRSRAEERYGEPVPEEAVDGLAGRMRQLLEDRLPAEGELRLLLRCETDAAQALRDAGGLPLPGGVALVCGPLWVAEMGLQRQFGSYAAALAAGAETDRLRIGFSLLGPAQAQLRAGRAKAALDALEALRCPECRAEPAGCPEACAGFAAGNPAHAALPDGRRRFADDAAALAMEAGLSLGQSALSGAEPDVAAATAHWRAALDRAQRIGRGAEAQAQVAEVALGRSDALSRAEDFDAAVMLLDFAQAFTHGEEHEQITGALAAELTARAIHTANQRPDSYEQPIADLRRATGLNPHLLRAQASLAIVRRAHAVKRWQAGFTAEASLILQESVEELTLALGLLPENRELMELLDKASYQLEIFLDPFGH